MSTDPRYARTFLEADARSCFEALQKGAWGTFKDHVEKELGGSGLDQLHDIAEKDLRTVVGEFCGAAAIKGATDGQKERCVLALKQLAAGQPPAAASAAGSTRASNASVDSGAGYPSPAPSAPPLSAQGPDDLAASQARVAEQKARVAQAQARVADLEAQIQMQGASVPSQFAPAQQNPYGGGGEGGYGGREAPPAPSPHGQAPAAPRPYGGRQAAAAPTPAAAPSPYGGAPPAQNPYGGDSAPAAANPHVPPPQQQQQQQQQQRQEVPPPHMQMHESLGGGGWPHPSYPYPYQQQQQQQQQRVPPPAAQMHESLGGGGGGGGWPHPGAGGDGFGAGGGGGLPMGTMMDMIGKLLVWLMMAVTGALGAARGGGGGGRDPPMMRSTARPARAMFDDRRAQQQAGFSQGPLSGFAMPQGPLDFGAQQGPPGPRNFMPRGAVRRGGQPPQTGFSHIPNPYGAGAGDDLRMQPPQGSGGVGMAGEVFSGTGGFAGIAQMADAAMSVVAAAGGAGGDPHRRRW